MAIDWHCPFCNRDTTLTSSNQVSFTQRLYIENNVGQHMVQGEFNVCPNPKCKKYTLDLFLGSTVQDLSGNYEVNRIIKHWSLIPPSKARSFPSYVPKPIIQDYEEACLILDGSQKSFCYSI